LLYANFVKYNDFIALKLIASTGFEPVL